MGDGTRLAIEIGNDTSGLTDEQDSGGAVPWSQRHFPERLEAAAGDVGQVERRRTGAAYPGRLEHDPRQHREISLRVRIARLEGEAGPDQRTERVVDLG